MSHLKQHVCAFVLAGGKSSRMQQDKAMLKIRGRYLIEYSIGVMQKLTDSVRIIGDPAKYDFIGLPVIPDCVPPNGPLGGIYTGLKSSDFRHNLFLACDMPFMESEFFKLLQNKIGDSDAAVIRFSDGKVEPLASIYTRRGLPEIERNIASRQYKITAFLDRIQVAYVGEEALTTIGLSKRIFSNINTPEDMLLLDALGNSPSQ